MTMQQLRAVYQDQVIIVTSPVTGISVQVTGQSQPSSWKETVSWFFMCPFVRYLVRIVNKR